MDATLQARQLFQSALAHQNRGKFDQAESLYRKALELVPERPSVINNLAAVLLQLKRYEEAKMWCEKLLAVDASNAVALLNSGNCQLAQRAPAAALALFDAALDVKPDYVEALTSRSKALIALRRQEEALISCDQALAVKPDHLEALNNRGAALLNLQRPHEALDCFNKVLAVAPANVEGLYNLGNTLQELGQLNDAVLCFRKALSVKPDFLKAHNNLGNALQELGKPHEAAASFHKALSLKPDYAQAHNNLGNALRDQGQHNEAILSYRQALALKPDYAVAYSNLLFTMQFMESASPIAIKAEHQRFAAQFEAPLIPGWQPHPNSRQPGRRLKLGYVSPDFRQHAVAYFIEPVLANHDKDRFEVFCYYNHVQHDEFTRHLAQYADHWLDCKRLSDAQLADRIRCDEIDILVDLAGHTANNRMLTFARKPAPIQITYLGYPGTSGLSAMDYRLTDGYADPEGSEAYYTEKLLRLPHSLCCYRPHKDMPEVMTLPALQNGYITFGSFNNFNKIDRRCIELWAQLLKTVAHSKLLMVTVPEGQSRTRLVEQFTALGVSAQRLEFQSRLSGYEFHQTFRRADVALDPFPVTGGTTTCESLWMGLPVIVLVGNRYISRVGYSFLNAAFLQEFAAESIQDYINIARRLAENLPHLVDIRARLRTQLATSPLMDEPTFTRNLESAYRSIWTNWCAKVT